MLSWVAGMPQFWVAGSYIMHPVLEMLAEDLSDIFSRYPIKTEKPISEFLCPCFSCQIAPLQEVGGIAKPERYISKTLLQGLQIPSPLQVFTIKLPAAPRPMTVMLTCLPLPHVLNVAPLRSLILNMTFHV